MRIVFLAIAMYCTSFTIVQKKLWLCYAYVDVTRSTEIITYHLPRVVAAKNYKEARAKFLHELMYKTPSLKGGIIKTDANHLSVEEITEQIIIN